MAKFDWDPNKERGNVEKHGIDFLTALELWSGDYLELETRPGKRRQQEPGDRRGRGVGLDCGHNAPRGHHTNHLRATSQGLRKGGAQ